MVAFDRADIALPDDLAAIRDAIVAAIPVEKMYLFGSFARGEQNDDSDYDICVVLKGMSVSMSDATAKAYLSLAENTAYRRPVDIICTSKDDFYGRLGHATMESIVEAEGVVIFDDGR